MERLDPAEPANRSDRRAAGQRGPRPLDAEEVLAEAEHAVAARMPYLAVLPNRMETQAIVLPSGGPGVAIRLSNAVVEALFPMDLEQARAHIEDVEKAILETHARHSGFDDPDAP